MSVTSCFKSNDLSNDPKYINKKIDEQLKIAKKLAKSQIKLLVLGAAESGKSTFLKQMQIIHGKGYTEEERSEYKTNILQNLTTSIRLLSNAMCKLDISYEFNENQIFGENFLNCENLNFDLKFVEEVKNFWKDHGIQLCYKRRNEFHLFDSASYFLNSVDRISKPDYIPNIQDVLRSRNPTAGICEYVFDIDNFIFGIVDVGGQKSERRKWIHCFDNVNSIIFLASLSEYDQTIPQEEIDQETAYSLNGTLMMSRKDSSRSNEVPVTSDDVTTNRRTKTVRRAFSQQTIRATSSLERRDVMPSKSKKRNRFPPLPPTSPAPQACGDVINRLRESAALFETIVHSTWFRSTSVILFLNKTDILEEKIQYSDLINYDVTFRGDAKNAEQARDHILERYVTCFNRHRNMKRTLYPHFTCATDTNNIRFVFAAIKDIILQNYLENYNLI